MEFSLHSIGKNAAELLSVERSSSTRTKWTDHREPGEAKQGEPRECATRPSKVLLHRRNCRTRRIETNEKRKGPKPLSSKND